MGEPHSGNGIQETSTAFRRYLPDLNTPRFTSAKDQTAYEYSDNFQRTRHPPWIFNLTETWKELLKEPFKGVTENGKVKTALFQPEDGGIDIARICQAVTRVLDTTTADQKAKLQYPMNAREWRCWSNPEFLLRPFGLRLEELPEELAQSILAVVEATFSPEGYQKALAAMRINHFLGELCQVEKVMNKYSYNFLLFGTPSTTDAWGWSLYGHHLCLNVFLKGSHMSITPTFTGAEPNIIDSGEWSNTEILHHEGDLGLRLMQSLPSDLQQQAQTYKLLRDPQMQQTGDLKTDRWNQDDQRHVCGAFRDNRVVPHEGIAVGLSFTAPQKQLVLDIVEQFVLYLPSGARQKRMQEVERHFDETYFSWIGEFGNDDPFYFRIQSAVIICEFDHHSGVFLTNKEPAKVSYTYTCQNAEWRRLRECAEK